jgi:hypothetical protein
VQYLVKNFPGLSADQISALLNAVNLFYQVLYQTPIFEDYAVCSQWPTECGSVDGRLVDGSFTDGPTLAQSVGQYQQSIANSHSNSSKSLKIILTNNNNYADTNVRFLEYFNTTFNQGIAPGDFIWSPPLTRGGGAEANPRRSKQIFAEYMDDATLLAAFVPINGTNLTTATYELTTLANPVFKVKAGLKVELLLLQINSNLPTSYSSQQETEANVIPLAELAQQIADSRVLRDRIQAFVGVAPAPTFAPTKSNSGATKRMAAMSWRRVSSIAALLILAIW